eukprot:GEMP01086474.1.p2 GENE.GEMP01086474.1~~GEMP01086474.1.p2  ORF type:complete len:119 (+),score=27.35 GEMP01086474.1:87-443(+)
MRPIDGVEDIVDVECAGDGTSGDATDVRRVEFRCKRCRFALFTSDEEHEHEPLNGACTSLFARPMNWMGKLETQTGKLVCVCGAKLGSYSWFGLSCSCKAWQTPAFQVHRSKVDEIRM